MWRIHLCTTDLGTLNILKAVFQGTDVSIELGGAAELNRYDALFLTASAAEKLGINLRPYEVVMVPKWPSLSGNLPPLILLGGILEKGDAICSIHSGAKVFASIVRWISQGSNADRTQERSLGIIAEYFLVDEDLDVRTQAEQLAATYVEVRASMKNLFN